MESHPIDKVPTTIVKYSIVNKKVCKSITKFDYIPKMVKNDYVHPWLLLSDKVPKNLEVTEKLFESLWNARPEKNSVKFRGKELPRKQVSYNREYEFSNIVQPEVPINNPYISKLLKWVQDYTKCSYNEILANWYNTGAEYIGPHSDETKDLHVNSAIVCFSLGETRTLRIHSIDQKGYKDTYSTIGGSFYIMGGSFQKHFKHEIVKESTNKKPGRRISFTFRWFKNTTDTTSYF